MSHPRPEPRLRRRLSVCVHPVERAGRRNAGGRGAGMRLGRAVRSGKWIWKARVGAEMRAVCANIHRLQIGFECRLLPNQIGLHEAALRGWGSAPSRPWLAAGRGSGCLRSWAGLWGAQRPPHGPRRVRGALWPQVCALSANSQCLGEGAERVGCCPHLPSPPPPPPHSPPLPSPLTLPLLSSVLCWSPCWGPPGSGTEQ